MMRCGSTVTDRFQPAVLTGTSSMGVAPDVGFLCTITSSKTTGASPATRNATFLAQRIRLKTKVVVELGSVATRPVKRNGVNGF